MAAFTLYGRAWCHLCDEMRAELESLAAEFGVGIDWIDIDDGADPALAARYDERVPVLLLDGAELCHYRLDASRVRAALVGRRTSF
jgi:thiol-disulfide isomerase/thioredoxin